MNDDERQTALSAPDLATWLLAQIAEDERRLDALDAVPADAWLGETPAEVDDLLFGSDGCLGILDRARADCDAKRRIIELHAAFHTCSRHVHEDVMTDPNWGVSAHALDYSEAVRFDDDEPCPTLRVLALPYADRPGYRDAWRP